MKKSLRYLLATFLLAGIIFIITITYLNYKVMPTEVHKINTQNDIEDGDFEKDLPILYDCCTNLPGLAVINISKSSDSKNGDYSLNLISSKHCSCVNKPILNFDNTQLYLLSLYYKGDKAQVNIWAEGDQLILLNQEFKSSSKWNIYSNLIKFSNKSTGGLIYFYANSDGTKTVTNLYDDLQVRKLISIKPSLNPDDYKQDQEYVIKTNPTNVISSICAKQYKDSEGKCPIEKLSDEGYYLVRGAPQVNLKFPWTELILIIIMMLIVIRLLFRKQVIKAEETFESELKKGLKKFR